VLPECVWVHRKRLPQAQVPCEPPRISDQPVVETSTGLLSGLSRYR
jgi:hypothetical protein